MQPHLTYCSSIWSNCSNELMNDILKLQKRAARIIFGGSYHTPSVNLFRQLKWLPIYNIIKMRKIRFVFRALKNTSPSKKILLFQMRSNLTNMNTRSSETDIQVATLKTEKSKINYSGATLFNSLPTEP